MWTAERISDGKKKPMDSSTDPENQILYAQKYSFSFLLHIKFQFFGNTQ